MSAKLPILHPRDYPGLDVYGVIGNPVAHSLSPQIHAMFAKQTMQSIFYGKIEAEVSDFEKVVNTFFEDGGKGLNCTVPFKADAYLLADHLSARAQAAGVVNILWKKEGQFHGDNSDGVGLVRDLERQTPLLKKNILILGAGGAVQGVILPLLEKNPATITIVNRTAHKAAQLVERFTSPARAAGVELRAVSFEELEALSSSSTKDALAFHIVINGTSTGLSDTSVWSDALAKKVLIPLEDPTSLLAYDMVYGKNTAFMLQMQTLGCRVSDGLGMLIEQAAVSFEIWRGISPGVLNTQAVYLALRNNASL